MGKHKYYELNEFVRSETAKKNGIDNTPSFEVVSRLDKFVDVVLDPLRAAWGSAIRINSGFRCELLNKLVGGSATSVHKIGWAVDITPVNGKFDDFVKFVVEWFKKTGTKFDQILIESDKKGNRWLHIGLYNNAGQQRGQIKVMNV